MGQGLGPGARRAPAQGAVGAGALATTAAATTGLAVAIARFVVTPVRHKPDDVELLEVRPDRVVLAATAQTRAPGRYGIWTGGGAGHLRVGEVLAHDEAAGRVERTLLGVDRGAPAPGPGRWNQYFHSGTPAGALGIAHTDVVVTSPVGGLPAWWVPAAAGAPHPPQRRTCAVLVHGRGATREEALRAVPVLHAAGLDVLVPSYRNDADGPSSPAGRYGLGDTEWHDVEAAVRWALERGAERVVLGAWSMGGAIVLQLVARSALAERVDALVLDGPVLDWFDVLDHQARRNRLPVGLGRYGLRLLAHPGARRVIGVDGPVDLRRMDWVARAEELRLPVLLLHSDDDEVVPSGPSHRLAAARPDLVTHVPSSGVFHTKEWNLDPAAWEAAVLGFLAAHGVLPAAAAPSGGSGAGRPGGSTG
ncbi:alpha/beta hydrolase [Kineococcus glutinatus]|uniref:Alpha/beta fold hydrolase n=1 Tax=Kineococcus glutinatus TaxID=1070872 RepID=A0ABP9I770_9ACTN